MTEIDPYNFPFPQKTQTMYLQTISRNDIGFQKRNIFKPESTSLKTNDIVGNESTKLSLISQNYF